MIEVLSLLVVLEMEVKKLRNREVKLVKVQWSEAQEDATWETEDKTCASYPFSCGYILDLFF